MASHIIVPYLCLQIVCVSSAVTLLALGNGAPDLVSSIAFVRAGQYRVAISGLLGESFPPVLYA